MIDPSFGILVAASAIVFGPLSGWVAGTRGRQPVVWLVLGALIGPVALAIVWLAPPGRCPTCDEPVEGWDPGPCPRCGAPYRRGEDRARPVAVAEAEAAPALAPDTRAAPTMTDPTAGRGSRTPRAAGTGVPADTGEPGSSRRPAGRPGRRNGHLAGEGVSHVAPAPSAPRIGAAPAPRPPAREIPPAAVTMITVAAYVGGSERLEIGTRYAIVRHGDALRVLGPVDTAPARVVVEHGLADLEVMTVGDRLLLSDLTDNPPRFTLAFRVPPGLDGIGLEAALRVGADEADSTSQGR